MFTWLRFTWLRFTWLRFTWLQQRAWPVLSTTWTRWEKHDGWLLSAAMAYYAAFSLFPICLVLISALGLVARFSTQFQNQQQELLAMVEQNTGPWLAEQLQVVLAGVQERAGVGGPMGLAALLFTVIGVFMQLEDVFDRIWDTGPPQARGWLATIRSALRDRFIAFLMLWLVGALLLALLVANMALTGLKPYVVQLPAGRLAWQLGQIAFTLAGNATLMAVIYKTFPDGRVRWRAAFGGGVLVAVIWQIGQQILISLVIGEKYSAYGVVGSFIAVMLWLYYASVVVFLGAEFVWSLVHPRQPGEMVSERPN